MTIHATGWNGRRSALLAAFLLGAAMTDCSQNGADPIGSRTMSLVTANNTITQAADESRAGWFPNQPLLDPAVVGSSNFKRMFDTQLQPGFSQNILGQPLVVGGNVLVVTEANNVYLVDALAGTVTASRNLGPPFDAAAALGCADVIPTAGITGTPVVDVTTGTAYLYSKSSAGAWSLHAVSTVDLSERAGFPVTIGGSAQNDATVTFDPFYELQRPGLLLMNGVVYAGFGSHCDDGAFRGWIIGVTTSGVIRSRFTTAAQTTATKGNGIWMAGSGLVSDGPDQIVFATGNGYGTPWTNPLPGNAPPGDLSTAVGRVVVQADGSLKTTDFFAPFNAVSLSQGNLEPSGIVALPPQFGTTAIPRLAVIAGKSELLYLLNRDNLGGFQQGPGGSDAVLAALPLGGGSVSRPGVWPGDGGYVYVTVNGGTSSTGFNLQVFKYGTDGSGKPTLTMVAIAPDDVGAFSGSPIVTSNGTTSGSALLWMTNLTGELRVYDALPVNGVLNIRFRNGYGPQAKWTTIGIGAGAAYVGTADGYLVGYGTGTPSVTGSPVAFGTVTVGDSRTMTATITANQNVTVNSLSSSSTAFVLGSPSAGLPVALTMGQSISVPVTFTPTDATSYQVALNVTTSSTPGALTMTGTGQANTALFRASPTSLNFGGVAIGSSSTLNISLSNAGTGTLTFTGVTAPAAPFSVIGAPPNGATLGAGASTTFSVRFSPTAAGSFMDAVSVATDGGSVTVPLAGSSGTPGNLVITPMSIDFGTVVAGKPKTMSFTLQNTGGLDLTISKSKPPALGAFVAQTSLLEGSTIAAGQTVTETVQLVANATGALSDVWVISGNDGSGLHNVTFTAYGVAALSGLEWVATASASDGADVPQEAIDPSGANTRWSSGQPQSGPDTQWYAVDMLAPQTFSVIRMDSGGDYARNWEVYASDSATSWGTAIATGTAATSPVVITFPTQTHRYLQIRQKPSPGTGAWWSIYALTVYGIPTTPVSGPLPRVGWVATGSSTAGGDVAGNALDDDSQGTRWSTGSAQSNAATQSYTVDMETAQTFNQIRMDSGGDYARNYQVFVSTDGVNWGSAVAAGSATASPVIVTFAPETARFLQVRQLTSAGTGAWWSIYDFNVIVGGVAPKPPLSRTGWVASASSTIGTDVPANAIDDSTGSRWSTGLPQSGAVTQSFTLDMQSPQTFAHITMASSGDYARDWQVYVSPDGTSWGQPVATGTASASPVAISFASTTARYIQIRQTTSAGTGSWWSIYDLNVYAP